MSDVPSTNEPNDTSVFIPGSDIIVMIGALSKSVLHLSRAVRLIVTDDKFEAVAAADAAAADVDTVLELFRSHLAMDIIDGR